MPALADLQTISFQIIASTGMARSCYIAAIDAAADGDFDRAEQSLNEGNEAFLDGHKVHLELLKKSANQELSSVDLLLVHAQDQLMSAESFGILAKRFIQLYRKLNT